MKRIFGSIICCCLTVLLHAQKVPFPAPGHEGLNVKKIGSLKIEDASELQFGFWTQNRIMYNLSNLPGPGGTDFENTSTYDFFRQRFRVAFDVRFVDTTQAIQAGVYTQLEYRGGWGGSSPAASDPRGISPINNPFNRLQARGIRYGFVYLNYKNKLNLSAGILPLTDGMGRVLFDADWDFNVGGVALGGPFLEKGNYRLAYVRLIDGIGAAAAANINSNSHLFLLDQSYPLKGNLKLSTHFYGLTVPEELELMPVKRQFWMGLNLEGQVNSLSWDGMLIVNSGKIGKKNNTGLAAKFGLRSAIGKGNLEFFGWFATGDAADETDNRFVTIHQIVGTAGYWGLGHIYTANGPSDVNDFGLEIGNGGAGLMTLQGKFGFPVYKEKVEAYVYGGWFRAMKDRNNSKNMGVEFGSMFTISFAKFLHLEVGAAYATVGDFFAEDADGIYEVFSRFQFTW